MEIIIFEWLYQDYKKMETYIVLLRGINVSGKNIIKMDELKKKLNELNYQNVKTYIQSGNIILQAPAKENKIIEDTIHQMINDKFGLKVPVIAKKAQELKKVLENNPFINNRNHETDRLYVTFLNQWPSKENIVKLIESKIETDEFILTHDIVYLHCLTGYGNTKLSNTFFESKLKVMATTRNWKTTVKLAEMSI